MTRYLALATVLVCGVLALAGGFFRRGPALQVASVQATVSPGVPGTQANATFVPAATQGIAPWALAALPECFRQDERWRGDPRGLASRLPPVGAELPAGATLRAADCRVVVGDGTIAVSRGDVHLTVPDVVRVYRTPEGELAVVRRGRDFAEVRTYIAR